MRLHPRAGAGRARGRAAGRAGRRRDDAAADSGGSGTGSDAAADSGYAACMNQLPESRRLSIVASQVVGGPHTDFPLLVSLQSDALRSAAMGGSVADPQGADLRFALDNAGTTPLSFELETYDPATGKLTAWVRIPTLDSTSALYLLFGSCATPLPVAAGSVWPSYSGVWHLGNNRESTAQNPDGVEEGSVPVTMGQIGSGRAFTVSGGAYNTGSSAAIDNVFASGGTISVWINPSASSSGVAARIASKVTPNSLNSYGWTLQLDPNPSGTLVFRYHFSGSYGYWVTPAGAVPLGSWHHIVVLYSSASATENPQMFVDSKPITLGNGNAPSGTAVTDVDSVMYIGNMGDGTRSFDGTIDEVRLARGTRSAGWIATEYNNQRDPAGFYVVSQP